MVRSAAARRLPEHPAEAMPPAPATADAGMPALAPVSIEGIGTAAVERERRRGRGAQSNASGRYEGVARVAFDDGWQSLEDLPEFQTSVTLDATRKVITRNDSPDISFDRSINPYRGCEHGCVYCFARPTAPCWRASGARSSRRSHARSRDRD